MRKVVKASRYKANKVKPLSYKEKIIVDIQRNMKWGPKCWIAQIKDGKLNFKTHWGHQ